MQAAAQEWVDSSISKTINVPEGIGFEAFKDVYLRAWETGCKGCTTYRPNAVTGSVLSETPAMQAPGDAATELRAPPDSNKADVSTEAHRLRKAMASHKDYSVKQLAKVTGLSQSLLHQVLSDRKTLGRQSAERLSAVLNVSPGWLLFGDEAPGAAGQPLTAPPGGGSSPARGRGQPSGVAGNVIHLADPLDRPETLPGETYKLRWPMSEHALYITINDIVLDGRRRPFEIFVNSKNMEHFAWTVALTRMISAVFRRGGDVSFVVEELKAVFDPRGGAWMGGKYVPSILAAIGGVIERHMIATGFLAGDGTGLRLDPADPRDHAAAPGPACPNCGSFELHMAEGCATCVNCGFSKCSG
jgi:ribonucleoside-diphosphate reductase alpha chain